MLKPLKDWGCYQSQNYKIWKQFTTIAAGNTQQSPLLSITKLQNLKAIHNLFHYHKWKIHSCYQSQNYKIWKQFTTDSDPCTTCGKLLSIAKLQNLKAIHNRRTKQQKSSLVVINHKTTKFESNSQPCHCPESELRGCYQSQNYKIWKQFTTVPLSRERVKGLLSIAKLQNLKAIHNARVSHQA